MINRLAVIIFFALFFAIELNGKTYGYIHAFTQNIGDDIQTLAAKRFLPEDSIPVDRDLIGAFEHPTKVDVLMNGWFMHPKSGKYLWPPSKVINPFFVSIHFTAALIPVAFSKENVKYLKKYAPIGARDYFTLNLLRTYKIPSYFSGCLTLTLHKDQVEREDVIYAVDLDKECIEYIRSKTTTPVVPITHESDKFYSMSLDERLNLARDLLEKYKRAKCVVTCRLHAALPCLAFETPLLFVNTQGDQSRFNGLIQLMRHVSKEELFNGDYNFDCPPPNSNDYLPIREGLIKLLQTWSIS